MAKKEEKKQLVINQIVIKSPQRKTSDVGEWRTALQSADMGRMKRLFDLYEDLLIDGILSDAVGKRIDAVTNSPITFQDAKGEEVQEIADLIDTPAFEDMLTEIMHARFWGRAAIEFDFANGFSVYEIPKKHIDVINKQILINEYDTTGVPYENDDNILVIGKRRDFGLFLKTAPYAIWKRGGFGDYAQWLEIFGMPQRVGKYSSYDPESRKLLEKALSEAGSAPWCVIPKETDVETVNNTGNGSSGSSYNDFRKACNEEMLITVLGQTLTTVQGDKGARSLGEVHKQVEEGKNKSDMRFVQRVLNYSVLPILEKRGFPVKGGKFVFPEAAEALSVSDIVSLSDIIDIPSKFLHDKYSIPVPKDGESIAKKGGEKEPGKEPDVAPKSDDSTADPKGDKKPNDGNPTPKPDKTLKNDDRNFFLKLWDFFAVAPAEVTGAKWNGGHLTLKDDNLNDRVISRIDGKTFFDAELFDYFSNDLVGALDGKTINLADLGFKYGYESDAYITAMELNLFRFSGAKTLAEITELNRLYRESTYFDDFYKKARNVSDNFNKKWQKTEWQTANLIASSTSNYNRLIKKTKLFPYWEYKTVGDDKVRPEHAKLDGVILPADDPRWSKIWPPNGWKCRCYVVPRMAHEVNDIDMEEMRSKVDAYFETTEWKMNESQGFGVNRALNPEVFNEDQMYIKKFPNQAGKLLEDVNYQTYNLGTYQQNRSKADTIFKPYDGTVKEFDKTLKVDGDKLFMTDHKGRDILYDITPDVEQRKVLTAASSCLESPDEAWIQATKGLNTIVYLKYYKDATIAVTAEIADGVVYRIKDMLKVNENKAAMLLRTGLLIFRKS